MCVPAVYSQRIDSRRFGEIFVAPYSGRLYRVLHLRDVLNDFVSMHTPNGGPNDAINDTSSVLVLPRFDVWPSEDCLTDVQRNIYQTYYSEVIRCWGDEYLNGIMNHMDSTDVSYDKPSRTILTKNYYYNWEMYIEQMALAMHRFPNCHTVIMPFDPVLETEWGVECLDNSLFGDIAIIFAYVEDYRRDQLP